MVASGVSVVSNVLLHLPPSFQSHTFHALFHEVKALEAARRLTPLVKSSLAIARTKASRHDAFLSVIVLANDLLSGRQTLAQFKAATLEEVILMPWSRCQGAHEAGECVQVEEMMACGRVSFLSFFSLPPLFPSPYVQYSIGHHAEGFPCFPASPPDVPRSVRVSDTAPKARLAFSATLTRSPKADLLFLSSDLLFVSFVTAHQRANWKKHKPICIEVKWGRGTSSGAEG